MKRKSKVGLVLALMVPFAAAAYASEYNFYEQADKRGCASIITERGQQECASVQRDKDYACRVPVECDVDKQERLVAKYNDAKDRLDRGQVADADKERLQETVRTLKEQLDRARAAAHDGTSIAQECVRRREYVQKWFIDTGIPLTEHTRNDALDIRKDLLYKLAEAQRKQADAKSKRDANPSDSSAQTDYDRATEEMRNCEKALEDFNNKYGKDIERYAEKLINHYLAEKESHQTPLNESKNAVENCRKVDNMSY